MIIDQTKLKEAIKQAIEEINDGCFDLRLQGVGVLLPEFIDFEVQLVTDINAVERKAVKDGESSKESSTEGSNSGETAGLKTSESSGTKSGETEAKTTGTKESSKEDGTTGSKNGSKQSDGSGDKNSTTHATTVIHHPSVHTQAGGTDDSDETVNITYKQ